MIAAFFLCAEWIAGTYVPPAETETRKFFEQARNDVVARTFAVRDIPVRRAIWRVAAPGMRDLFVNDECVTATALPPLTPYRKRVLEESFDVTSRIRRGAANMSTNGEAELAGRIVTHEGDPGWFHMIDCGATTLWEGWHAADCSGIYSNCHPMFGSVDEWMVRHVLGIAVCDDAVGCDRVMIDPKPVAGVTSASGWLDTPKGRISVSWKLVEGKLIVEKTVPKDIAEVPSADKRVAAEETPGTRSIRHE